MGRGPTTLDLAVESVARGREWRRPDRAARGSPRTRAAEHGEGVRERGCRVGRAGGSEGASEDPAGANHGAAERPVRRDL